MQKILITEFMDEDAVAQLQAKFDVTYLPNLVDDRAKLCGMLSDVAAIIVRNRTQVDAELLAAAPNLKLVGRLGVGLDNIKLDLCKARNIKVIPATGANALAVAEYVMATSVMLLRGAYHATTQVAAGQWPRTALSSGREARGSTLGLVGFGNIGQETAKLCTAIGMKIIAFDPVIPASDPMWEKFSATSVSLDTIFRTANVVSLHVPFVPETKQLVNKERLAMMPKGAILINTARGEVVDEIAVAEALRSGHLGGAALDVFAPEPLAAGSVLAECPNLILTPHIAGVTHEANIRVSTLIADKVTQFLS